MRTVITYGTFDLFHQGHYNILKRAKEEGDYLIVGVTGETYDMERGKLSVQDSLATRIENVQNTGFADKIIVEEYLGQKISDILKYHVDVLVIGSDWKGKFDHLRKYCEVKYLERTKNISSTQIREEKLNIYKCGIATTELYDHDIFYETHTVSSIHLQSVFSPDEKNAKEFAKKYELESGYSDYDKFLDDIDIVIVKMPRDVRYEYVKKALEKGKHVVTDMPATMDSKKQQELHALAEEKGVLLYANIVTLYQQAFGQLLWMARGNLIGDIINVKCSVSQNAFDENSKVDLIDLAYYPVCVITKILGFDSENVISKIVKDENGNDVFASISFAFDNATANVEIGTGVELDGTMTITGSEGEIYVPEDWWRMGYFKYRNKGELRAKHYSSNFDGNGYRYLIQAVVNDIKQNNTKSERITNEEAEAILKVLKEI